MRPLRCARAPAAPACVLSLLCGRWYKVLDRTVLPDKPRSNAAVLIKTAADQLVWAPIMTVVFFAVLKSLEGHPELIWETVQVGLPCCTLARCICQVCPGARLWLPPGQLRHACLHSTVCHALAGTAAAAFCPRARLAANLAAPACQDKLVKTVVANYILWPGAHFINFKFVPTEHRILYNNCVSVRGPPASPAPAPASMLGAAAEPLGAWAGRVEHVPLSGGKRLSGPGGSLRYLPVRLERGCPVCRVLGGAAQVGPLGGLARSQLLQPWNGRLLAGHAGPTRPCLARQACLSSSSHILCTL